MTDKDSMIGTDADLPNILKARCFDCGFLYEDPAYIETSIPDKVWDIIRPADADPGCGILCINCISKRLVKHGLKDVPVWFCGIEPLRAISGSPPRKTLREWEPGSKLILQEPIERFIEYERFLRDCVHMQAEEIDDLRLELARVKECKT